MQVPKKAWVFVGIATAIAILVALFEWNWLRSPFANYLSGRVGRPVTINGDLQVELSRKPLVVVNSLVVANPAWASEPEMARAQRVAFRVDLGSLFNRPIVLTEVTLAQPRVVLERDATGRANWQFEGGMGETPRMERLIIEDGFVQFRNPDTGTDVTINVASPAASESGKTPVHFSGSGRLRNNPFTIEGDAATLLALENQDKPFALNVRAKAGNTSAHFDGTVVPARLDTVD
jgi:uncharacterized protein involved in outer membrane biogenesis